MQETRKITLDNLMSELKLLEVARARHQSTLHVKRLKAIEKISEWINGHIVGDFKDLHEINKCTFVDEGVECKIIGIDFFSDIMLILAPCKANEGFGDNMKFKTKEIHFLN